VIIALENADTYFRHKSTIPDTALSSSNNYFGLRKRRQQITLFTF